MGYGNNSTKMITVDFSSEITGKLNTVDEIAKKPNLPKELLTKVKKKLPFPTGFSWTNAPINVYKDASGKITTDFDAANFKPDVTGKVKYYVSLLGNDSNDGLTPQTPLKNVNTARNKSDVGIIEIAEGFYPDGNAFNNSSGAVGSKSMIIQAAPNANVIIAAGRTDGLVWTKTSGKSKVYETSRTSAVDPVDMNVIDENGDFKKLKSKTSIDEVDSTPGTYYYNSPMLYVHTYNSIPADSKIFVPLDIYNFKNVGNHHVYFENIKFYGGKEGCISISSANSSDAPLVVAKNCEFKYASNGNGGVHIMGADSYLQNCVAALNARDGFNYHKFQNFIPKTIEVGCKGRSNGIGRGTDTDNGSTTHEGGKIIRVNGVYHGNEGPNIHDINLDSQAWNLGCESYGSKANQEYRRTNYRVEEYAKMWLDSCIGYDSDSALYGSTTCEINISNSLFDKEDVLTATVNYY